jgi:hypothetical protein
VDQIYSHKNYKSYLQARLQSGEKTKFSKFIGCQPSFVSQVLRSGPNFSLEQGVLINDYFKHDQLESRFFILLLQYSRAGSKKLEQFYLSEMEEAMRARQQIASRVKATYDIKENVSLKYYSDFNYLATHVLCSILTENQIEYLKEKLNLSSSELKNILSFLEQCGLVEKTDKQYLPTIRKIHLSDQSEQINMHHKNFRIHTIEKIRLKKSDDLHYSVLAAFSKNDVIKMRELLLSTIEKSEKIIAPSSEETAYAFCLDFYSI